jgi:hypothetical protein
MSLALPFKFHTLLLFSYSILSSRLCVAVTATVLSSMLHSTEPTLYKLSQRGFSLPYFSPLPQFPGSLSLRVHFREPIGVWSHYHCEAVTVASLILP